MNIINATVEIGTKNAKSSENGVDDVKTASAHRNITNERTIKSDVNF